MTHDANARYLIAQSVRENRCPRAPYRTDLHEDLLAECEDFEHEPDNNVNHYWGTTDSGYEWSVRLRDVP